MEIRYIKQMEIILADDPNVSEKVKGIAEGMVSSSAR